MLDRADMGVKAHAEDVDAVDHLMVESAVGPWKHYAGAGVFGFGRQKDLCSAGYRRNERHLASEELPLDLTAASDLAVLVVPVQLLV